MKLIVTIKYWFLCPYYQYLYNSISDIGLSSSIIIASFKQYINTEVFNSTRNINDEAILQKTYQLQWACHMARTEESHLPKILLFEELTSGQRSGASLLWYKESLNSILISCVFKHHQWWTEAVDRSFLNVALSGNLFQRTKVINKKLKNRKLDKVSTRCQTLPSSWCDKAQFFYYGFYPPSDSLKWTFLFAKLY